MDLKFLSPTLLAITVFATQAESATDHETIALYGGALAAQASACGTSSSQVSAALSGWMKEQRIDDIEQKTLADAFQKARIAFAGAKPRTGCSDMPNLIQGYREKLGQ